MATISSTGIGSGLDVNSIVSQLVALEKAPLKVLEVKAANVQAQISAFGEIQSQFAALTDVASRLSAPGVWAARTSSSSNTSAATITASSTASATSFRLDVDQLAQKQSVSSAALPPATVLGAGTLTINLGAWDATGSTFSPGTALGIEVPIADTDTIANIASKINAADAGVVATVFNDGTNQRLLLSSKATGAAAGFQVLSGDAALAGLVFDPQGSSGQGMAANGIPVQFAQDAKARINGLEVSSATNKLVDNIPGVTIDLLAVTTTGYDPAVPTGSLTEVKSPITMSVTEDVTVAVKNVTDFVTAYNTLNKSLADLTKYNASDNTAGLFQGDSSIRGLRSILGSMLGSASMGATLQRLSDVGLSRQLDGSLTINTTKLSEAANSGSSLQQLFTNNNNDPLTNGFALKFRDLGKGVAASGGALANKQVALQRALDTNAAAQERINDRAVFFESRLRKQYSALDAQMAQLNALNSYVAQQVTLWNKSSS